MLALLVQHDKVWAIGVLLAVLDKIRVLLLVMELFEDDVRNRHPKCTVAAGVERHPLVRVFAHLAKIRREDHRFGAVMPCFCKEMTVRRARHAQTRANIGDHLGVVPIRALAHVGLVAPDFRERGREIAVPIVETEVHAAEKLEETCTCGVAQHGHGRDRREADDPVGTVFFCRVNIGNCHQFQRFVPTHASESTLSARILIAAALLRTALQRLPGLERIASSLLFFSVEIDQRATDQRVFDAKRAIQIPGK